METYCIDTSALIDGWKDYPIEHFGVWDKIHDLIKNQHLISPYHVLGELKVKEDNLYDWCKSEKLLFSSPTENTIVTEKEIILNFPEFKPKKTPKADWADPWVISIAIENNCSVISHETEKAKTDRTWYIPDVCADYGIEHIRFLDLIKKENWIFQ
jgi:hypothetical protein